MARLAESDLQHQSWWRRRLAEGNRAGAMSLLPTAAFAMALMLLLSVMAGPAMAQSGFAGRSLPEPPMQFVPSRPVQSQLPAVAARAMQDLMTAGLPDPRQCDYREVTITVGQPETGRWGTAVTHAWVLPAGRDGDGGNVRFAIAWNGSIYPVHRVGAPADLKADIEALLTRDAQQLESQLDAFVKRERLREQTARAEGQAYERPQPVLRSTQPPSEWESIQLESISPLKAMMLLRAGEAGLASRMWYQWHTAQEARLDVDPFGGLALRWLYAMQEQALGAFARGEDAYAAAVLAKLAPVSRRVEQLLDNRGNDDGQAARARSLEAMLARLPRLRRDLDRRMAQADQAVSPSRRVTGAAQAVTALSEMRWPIDPFEGNEADPSVAQLRSHWQTRQLGAMGAGAVDRLLAVVAGDDRLTRMVVTHPEDAWQRVVLGVEAPAVLALQQAMGPMHQPAMSKADTLPTLGVQRRAIAAEMKAWWQGYGQTPEPQRWLLLLADDSATPQQWALAANQLAALDVDARAKARDGEPFRGLSVAAWIAKRVDSLVDEATRRPLAWQYVAVEPETALRLMCQMAVASARWDAVKAKDAIECAYGQVIDAAMQRRLDGGAMARLTPLVAQLELVRIAGSEGDAEQSEYVTWLAGIDWSHAELDVRAATAPIWAAPDSAGARALAEWLFLDREVPNPMVRKAEPGGRWCLQKTPWVRAWIDSPLLGVPAFRQRLIQELQDKGPALAENGDGRGTPGLRTATPSTSSKLMVSQGDSRGLINAENLRRCDALACVVGSVWGTPTFDSEADAVVRDARIHKLREHLERVGDMYRWPSDADALAVLIAREAKHDARGDSVADATAWEDELAARPQLQPLDRAATAADVEAGKAVFALDGIVVNYGSRVMDLPARAQWLRDGELVDAIVCQIEEQSSTVGRKRWAGLVTREGLHRVPAEQVTLKLGDEWSTLEPNLAVLLIGPQQEVDEAELRAPARVIVAGMPQHVGLRGVSAVGGAGDDAAVSVWVTNRSLAECRLPGAFIQHRRGQWPRLHRDLKLEAWYSPTGMPALAGQCFDEQQVRTLSRLANWRRVEVQMGDGYEPQGATVSLRPGESVRLFRLDLKDVIQLDRRGAYRVSLQVGGDLAHEAFARGQARQMLFGW